MVKLESNEILKSRSSYEKFSLDLAHLFERNDLHKLDDQNWNWIANFFEMLSLCSLACGLAWIILHDLEAN